MSTYTTPRPVNLAQLASPNELNTDALSMDDDGTERTVTCHDPAITQAQLQAAVDAHNAIDEEGNRVTLEQQALAAMQNNRDDIATNNTYAAITNPTNAQVAAQVKALTAQSTRQARQLNGAIRLLLGKLDGTD